MWTVDDVATFLEVSRATVFRLVAQRRLAFYSLPGGMRIKPEDVDVYVESVRTDATNRNQYGEKG